MSDTIGHPLTIGFLGAGKMATALARGWLDAGLISPQSRASDPISDAREQFSQQTGLTCTDNNLTVCGSANVLILAVKPQSLPDLLREIGPKVGAEQLVVSIVAGVKLAAITSTLGAARVIRVMPNTPALVGAGAAGVSVGDQATPNDLKQVIDLFCAVGVAVAVPESLLDAVTGLSGSGPAYVYQIIEALSDGGVRMGLPRDVATRLAAQTVLGSAKMVLDTGKHPAELKDMVTSPGGTTIAGLHELECGGLRAALMNAVKAATERATELGS